jgi:ElaA protein
VTDDYILRTASFDQLDARTLYLLLQLRVDVFVVEQQCPYPELDGRDTEPSAQHLWLERAGTDERATTLERTGTLPSTGAVEPAGTLEQVGTPVAYARLLDEPDGSIRIGRVVVARNARGAGLATRLMHAALAHTGNRRCVLDAQSYLVDFYAGLGFSVAGPEFLDDGVPHVPMARLP